MKKQNYFKTIFLLLLFSININAQVPPYVPTNGLVGWWPFNGNAIEFNTSATPSTNSASLTADRFLNANCAYSFNGTSMIKYLGSNPLSTIGNSTQNWTFNFWVKASNSSGGKILGSFGWGYSMNLTNTNNLRFDFINSSLNWSTYTSLSSLSINNWHLVTVTRSNGTIQMFIDNIPDNTFASTPNINAYGQSNSWFGANGQDNNGFFIGTIDDIGIWNRALSSCEINQLYTASLATISIVASNSLICAGQNATLNVGGANTYTWSNSSNLTSVVVSPSVTMAYSVAGTNSAGCTSTSAINLTVNPNPIITVNNGTICAGQNFTINPNGANTYTIQGGNAVVSPPSNANYTVVGTSTAGCVSQAFATSNLTVNPNPIITVNNGAICVGQNFTINPNGANTYTIQGGSAVVSPTSNASFTVAGTSTAGCLSQAFATSNLTVNPNPTITVNNGTICVGQNFTINPNGANTYTIQGGNAVVSPTSNSNYTVVGTSTAGCLSQAFASISLIVNANPSITVNSGAICAGQNFTINPNGANTYTIQGGNAVVSPPSNSSYTVAGTSTAGCLSQAVATSSLIVNANPSITVNSGAICAGQNFTINPNGANTYTIQGGNAVVSPSINTTYTVIGTSTAGCISQAFVTSSLTVNPNPIITVNNGTICAGQNFTINPNGANTYTIQGGNAVVSPTSNSNYTVVGSSTAGCLSQAVATSSLIVNASPTVTVNSGAICIGESFTISPNGANTYTIQGASAVVSPSINTTYTVIGTSTAGCVSQAFATSSLTVNQCVGITNQNMDLGGVSIYPNPNNGEFTIELVSVNNTYIIITNVLGQIIKTQKAELINQINLNLFEKGIYFINVMENNQSVYRGSIIKE